MHSLHYREVNVVSNYQTQLTPAYTKPAEALWQQQQIADTETQLLRLPILHDALFSFFFFLLTVNKTECGSGESRQPRKGYQWSLRSAERMLAASTSTSQTSSCRTREQVWRLLPTSLCLAKSRYNPCLLTRHLAAGLENPLRTSCWGPLLYSTSAQLFLLLH